MPERILCEEGLRVSLEADEGHLMLTVGNGAPTSFVTEAALLQDALSGFPLQLSSPEGYCHIEAEGDGVRLEYAIRGAVRKTCSIPVRDLQDALGWVRDLEEE
ncbi:hypothetical protein EON82_19370 [bacterium]|nr:MAG: hypothetical protein EON82_19370 [bacterium]